MLKFEDDFAKAVGSSRLRLADLTYMYGGGEDVDERAHNKLIEEHDNTLKIQDYYKNQLYSYLINKADSMGIEITDAERYYIFTDFNEGKEAKERITTSLIGAYGGLQNFQQFIGEYNQYVKDNYLSNKQIVSLGETKDK